MSINFIICGRLGNAIFRYFASALICIESNMDYVINMPQTHKCDDNMFVNMMKQNNFITHTSYNMTQYYQHDMVYRNNMSKLKQYIKDHDTHYVMTDGVNAGDGKREKFMMIDILNTPIDFTKYYDTVLHIRLEDFVKHNLYISVERIISLLNNVSFDNLCLVCKAPTTEFEISYINTIKECMKKKGIDIIIESNDILTDFHIMKNARILICSKSTLSWCAALLSDNLSTCYFPEYSHQICMTCTAPIDNTITY